MKKVNLFLLSSALLAYGTQHVSSAQPPVAGAARTAPQKSFSKEDLVEENVEGDTSEAAQRLEDAKRRRADLATEIAEKQKELAVVTKEEQEASRNAGTEGADRLKRKIAQHMDNIKATEDEIKQTTANVNSKLKVHQMAE